MSLWWAKKEQLDPHQVQLIEDLPLDGQYLIIGPPGSGKTNILLRRAQFSRMQNRTNVLVLTFTRSLTEFLRTGCYKSDGSELFPPSLLNTLESWQRQIHRDAGRELPDPDPDFTKRKRDLALSTKSIIEESPLPKFDALFVDEVQDLLTEEVELLLQLSDNIYCVGDQRQRIYDETSGLDALRKALPDLDERNLPFHYRLAPEICEAADRIQVSSGVQSLASTEHYNGPKPGRVEVEGPLSRSEQMEAAATVLRDQIRVYSDLIDDGDMLAVIVPRQDDREEVHAFLEREGGLAGQSQIVRARSGDRSDADYSPVIDRDRPILILTAPASKGLEFRALQWLFADDLQHRYGPEMYYTVITRAKTTVDIYYDNNLPSQIAKACVSQKGSMW